MYHCFGGKIEEDADFRQLGSNVGWLTSTDRDYDPISGILRGEQPRGIHIPRLGAMWTDAAGLRGVLAQHASTGSA